MEGGTGFIQELPGHNSIKTTMRYTHVSKRDIRRIENPVDKLQLYHLRFWGFCLRFLGFSD